MAKIFCWIHLFLCYCHIFFWSKNISLFGIVCAILPFFALRGDVISSILPTGAIQYVVPMTVLDHCMDIQNIFARNSIFACFASFLYSTKTAFEAEKHISIVHNCVIKIMTNLCFVGICWYLVMLYNANCTHTHARARAQTHT